MAFQRSPWLRVDSTGTLLIHWTFFGETRLFAKLHLLKRSLWQQKRWKVCLISSSCKLFDCVLSLRECLVTISLLSPIGRLSLASIFRQAFKHQFLWCRGSLWSWYFHCLRRQSSLRHLGTLYILWVEPQASCLATKWSLLCKDQAKM